MSFRTSALAFVELVLDSFAGGAVAVTNPASVLLRLRIDLPVTAHFLQKQKETMRRSCLQFGINKSATCH